MTGQRNALRIGGPSLLNLFTRHWEERAESRTASIGRKWIIRELAVGG